MKYFISLSIFLLSFSSTAQSIYVEGGLLFLRNTIESPLKYGKQVNTQEEYMMIGYEHYFPKLYNTYISFDYSYYFVGAEFTIENPELNLGFGFGENIIEGHIFALGIRKPFYIIKNRLNISGGVYIKAIKINRTWPDTYYTVAEEQYVGHAGSNAFPGWKAQPEIRIAIDVRFLWRLHFYTNWGFSKGFSKWQEIFYYYSYEGIQQPKALNYVDGTGYFANIGLKFDFVSQAKKR